jgi:mannose-6-phosphate isomerase-like protein (cupin superfamily)
MIKTEYGKVQSYTTKDGSLIRELMHPDIHGNSRQSLAEAIVSAGATTILHRHLQSEEIYHIIEGIGEIVLGDDRFEVVAGDTICIPAGVQHKIKNSGKMPLKILCCCSPPYSHDDTELIK